MNALYVTVSIPLLLVLAGFNHAHGLTTFGKPNSQNTQPQQRPPAQARSCTSQANCTLIKATTCVRGSCLCGDNQPPYNGKCSALRKGGLHICQETKDCVKNAQCVAASNKTNQFVGPNEKICVCDEDFTMADDGICGGESNFIVLPGLILLVNGLSRLLY